MSDLDDYYQNAPLAKPIPRKRLKARAKREKRAKHGAVRDYISNRDGNCRCCRLRAGESMDELTTRGAGGKVSKRNSIWVCGTIVGAIPSCHTYLQLNQITVIETLQGAEGMLTFTPRSREAADWMHLPIGRDLESGPYPQIRGESEC